MNKHTKGPWTIENHVDSFSIKRITTNADHPEIADNRTVVDTILSIQDGTLPNRANAKLIAAAPEMLEALQGVWEAKGQQFNNDPDMQLIFKAIRKAIGE